MPSVHEDEGHDGAELPRPQNEAKVVEVPIVRSRVLGSKAEPPGRAAR